MTLTSADIEQIRTFISKRGFTELDLQLEIMDHVACRVEELITVQPALSLEQAIQITHAEFGVMGFSVFEDSMRSSLQKQYLRMFGQLFLSCFNWKLLPAMLATVYLVGLICSHIAKAQMLYNYTGFALLIAGAAYGLANDKKFKPYRKMLTFRMGNAFLVICVVMVQVYNYAFMQFEVFRYLPAVAAGWLYAFVLLLIGVTFYAVRKMQQHALQRCQELQHKYQFALK